MYRYIENAFCNTIYVLLPLISDRVTVSGTVYVTVNIVRDIIERQLIRNMLCDRVRITQECVSC